MSGTAGDTLLTFRLRSTTFGIHLSCVVEVVRMVEVTPVPGLPAMVLGMINYRGVLLPVLEPAESLGLCRAELRADACIIIVDLDGRQLGLAVDGVEGLLDGHDAVVSRHAELLPETRAAQPATLGTARRNDELVLIIDLQALVGSLSDLDVIDAVGAGGGLTADAPGVPSQ